MCGGRSREWGSVKNGRSINGYPLSDIVVRSLVNGTAFDVLMNERRNRIPYFSLCTAERDSMRVLSRSPKRGGCLTQGVSSCCSSARLYSEDLGGQPGLAEEKEEN